MPVFCHPAWQKTRLVGGLRPEGQEVLEKHSGRLGNRFARQDFGERGRIVVGLRRYEKCRHMPRCKLPAGRLTLVNDRHAAVPFIQPDGMQAIVGGPFFAFDALHEVEAVEQDQPGHAATLVVAPRDRDYRFKIVVIKTGPGGAHINERGDLGVGHIGLSVFGGCPTS